jgi:hypothetical protein
MAKTKTKNTSEKCAARGSIATSVDERQAFCSRIFGFWVAKQASFPKN